MPSRSPAEIAADRLVRLATGTVTSRRGLARAARDTLDAWAARPDRMTLAGTLRGLLAAGLAEAREQASDLEAGQRTRADATVAALLAGVQAVEAVMEEWR